MQRNRLLALGTALTLLTSCSMSEDTKPVLPKIASITASEQAQRFPQYYAQEIKWEPCVEKQLLTEDIKAGFEQLQIPVETVECATIKAPLNWEAKNEAETESIELAVSRIHATQVQQLNHSQAIFTNPGGPGESGRFTWVEAVSAGQALDVLDSFDLIGFDPRGIGESTPLECEVPADDKDLGEFIKECSAKNPIAAYMGTSSVARDMELLRALLKLPQLDYLGYSYGTMLGATYATIFPENAGKLVLDSAENAQWATPEHAWKQQVAVADATLDLVKQCQSEFEPLGWVEKCPFVSVTDSATQIAQLNEKPLDGEGENKVDGEILRDYLAQGLYQADTERAQMFNTIAAALSGDKTAVETIFAMDYPFLEASVAEESEGGAFEAPAEATDSEDENAEDKSVVGRMIVTCHSFPKKPNLKAVKKEISVDNSNPLLDTEAGSTAVETALDTSCLQAKYVGTDINTRFSAEGMKTPVLVIGVRGDHATPYQYAQALAKELGNAKLLTLNGPGHGAAYVGKSQCVDAVVNNYFLSGKLPKKLICEPNSLSGE